LSGRFAFKIFLKKIKKVSLMTCECIHNGINLKMEDQQQYTLLAPNET